MFRKFKSGYFHNIKNNKFEFAKTKMVKMELDEYEKLTKVSSNIIYNYSVFNRTKKILNHRDNNYKITNDNLDDDY